MDGDSGANNIGRFDFLGHPDVLALINAVPGKDVSLPAEHFEVAIRHDGPVQFEDREVFDLSIEVRRPVSVIITKSDILGLLDGSSDKVNTNPNIEFVTDIDQLKAAISSQIPQAPKNSWEKFKSFMSK